MVKRTNNFLVGKLQQPKVCFVAEFHKESFGDGPYKQSMMDGHFDKMDTKWLHDSKKISAISYEKYFISYYTESILSVEIANVCLRSKSKNNHFLFLH